MKKSRIFAVLFALVILLGAALVNAQTNQQEDFYNACIVAKISQCQTKASFDESRSAFLSGYAEVNHKQAVFYRNNKEQLLENMMNQDLPLKTHRVEYFLIKAFFDQNRTQMVSSR